ncbi:MAG: cytochrome b/b6 domain-containing protein [Planctomycetota bacterium]|nr:cytochrome b/b6 domain-containing protein [Planctomycetota bacterium]
MRQGLVYDLPTRLFHATFAALFIAAFALAKLGEDQASVFRLHMLAGLTLGSTVLLRVLWGLFGTKHARFTGFALSPAAFVRYFRGILSGSKERWAGHNPASSWVGLAMLALAGALGFTGWQMANGNGEQFEDVHELFANAFAILALAHVAGVVVHTVRHRDPIALSMIHGRKNDVAESETIPATRPLVGVAYLAIVLGFGTSLATTYDSNAGTVSVLGTTIKLGEGEEEDEGEGRGREDDDDDDEEEGEDDD